MPMASTLLASLAIFGLIVINGVVAQFPPCYVCAGDADATISNPGQLLDVPASLRPPGFENVDITCALLFNIGLSGSVITPEQCALSSEVEEFLQLCGCSNYVPPTQPPTRPPRDDPCPFCGDEEAELLGRPSVSLDLPDELIPFRLKDLRNGVTCGILQQFDRFEISIADQCAIVEQFPEYEDICLCSNKQPTKAPATKAPTVSPTPAPTTLSPTLSPLALNQTRAPTEAPTASPTASPTVAPTMRPTGSPTTAPTRAPSTAAPSVAPTPAPTSAPVASPTSDGVRVFVTDLLSLLVAVAVLV